ncbi:oxalate:formate antiporter-like isoform X2 [Elysia marginata]|uniref:Oxalate:formate antiporter-like isoform X2 n=1 Tax=Elysia marginata TaxID=1093978 RepID=A0AAV4GCC3_9GAST|nr:oxalate:formate antiporter-like isoform X2 [Elysia marginata]
MLMGVGSGLGLGPTICIAFMYINGWGGKHGGLLVGTSTSAPTFLSIAQNQIITAYVNPKNLQADALVGVRAYFSQPEVLERVPEIVLILGVMGLILQIVGYSLVSDPPTGGYKSSSEAEVELGCNDNSKTKSTYSDQSPPNGKGTIYHQDFNSKSNLVNKEEPTKHYEANSLKADRFDLTSQSNGQHQGKKVILDDAPNSNGQSQVVKSVTPLEALKSGDFYALWLFGVALGYALILKNNYYKQFGLLYINNDLFLTMVGSLIPVFASAARVVLGTLIDRDIFSIQDTLVISLGANAFLTAFWFLAPQVSDIAYMVLILLLASAHAMVHTIVGTGVIKLFGNDYFTLIYGMVYSGGCIAAIISAVVVTPLLETLGWFWLFASCSILSVIVLVYTAVYDLCFIKK